MTTTKDKRTRAEMIGDVETVAGKSVATVTKYNPPVKSNLNQIKKAKREAIRGRALEWSDMALGVLYDMMISPRVPHKVRRDCAMDLLAYGVGARPSPSTDVDGKQLQTVPNIYITTAVQTLSGPAQQIVPVTFTIKDDDTEDDDPALRAGDDTEDDYAETE